MQEGLLINCTHDTVLRMLPPYIITEKEIDRGDAHPQQSFQGCREAENRELSIEKVE